MSTLSEVQQWAQDEYERLFAEFYGGASVSQQATLIVEESDHPSGYWKQTDTIRIRLGGWDVQQGEVSQLTPWPTWKSHLVHEMLHEYQHKVATRPGPTAEALYAKHQSSPSKALTLDGFWGDGHDEHFYEAICIQADVFDMKPEELLKVL
jgi:hypothetical protein